MAIGEQKPRVHPLAVAEFTATLDLAIVDRAEVMCVELKDGTFQPICPIAFANQHAHPSEANITGWSILK